MNELTEEEIKKSNELRSRLNADLTDGRKDALLDFLGLYNEDNIELIVKNRDIFQSMTFAELASAEWNASGSLAAFSHGQKSIADINHYLMKLSFAVWRIDSKIFPDAAEDFITLLETDGLSMGSVLVLLKKTSFSRRDTELMIISAYLERKHYPQAYFLLGDMKDTYPEDTEIKSAYESIGKALSGGSHE